MPWASVAELLGEGGLGGLFFLLAGELGGGGGDLGLDQGLEPGPGDASVGGLGDRGVDVGGLVLGQVAGLACTRGGRRRRGPRRPRPGPTAVGAGGAGPGRRRSAGRRRRASGRSGRPNIGGRELGDLRGAVAAQAAGLLPSRQVGWWRGRAGRGRAGPPTGRRRGAGRPRLRGWSRRSSSAKARSAVLAHVFQRRRRSMGRVKQPAPATGQSAESGCGKGLPGHRLWTERGCSDEPWRAGRVPNLRIGGRLSASAGRCQSGPLTGTTCAHTLWCAVRLSDRWSI